MSQVDNNYDHVINSKQIKKKTISNQNENQCQEDYHNLEFQNEDLLITHISGKNLDSFKRLFSYTIIKDSLSKVVIGDSLV